MAPQAGSDAAYIFTLANRIPTISIRPFMMYKIVLNQNFIHIGNRFSKNKLHRLHALKNKYVLIVFFMKVIFCKN